MAETKEWEVRQAKNDLGFEIYHRLGPNFVDTIAERLTAFDANLIVAEHNACVSVNPSNPLAVAESIVEAFLVLNGIRLLAQEHTKMPKDVILKAIKPVLSKAGVASQKKEV